MFSEGINCQTNLTKQSWSYCLSWKWHMFVVAGFRIEMIVFVCKGMGGVGAVWVSSVMVFGFPWHFIVQVWSFGVLTSNNFAEWLISLPCGPGTDPRGLEYCLVQRDALHFTLGIPLLHCPHDLRQLCSLQPACGHPRRGVFHRGRLDLTFNSLDGLVFVTVVALLKSS